MPDPSTMTTGEIRALVEALNIELYKRIIKAKETP